MLAATRLKRAGTVLAFGLALEVGVLATLAAASGAGAPARGGRSGSASATTLKGVVGVAATGVASKARQPCDLKARGGFVGVQTFGTSQFDDQRFLIVDALPSEAQVFLDGHLLGTAGQLIARALPIAPGRHALEVVAPGFRPYIAVFSTDPSGFPRRIRTRLARE